MASHNQRLRALRGSPSTPEPSHRRRFPTFAVACTLMLAGCGPATPVPVEAPSELGIPEVLRAPDHRDYFDVAGVYDLDAVVTTFDPAWGQDLSGYRYAAVVTFSRGVPPALKGTFSEPWLIGPAGDSLLGAATGTVSSWTDADANDDITLHRTHPDGAFTVYLGPDSVTQGVLPRHFLAGGHISGTWKATRRQARAPCPPGGTETPHTSGRNFPTAPPPTCVDLWTRASVLEANAPPMETS